MKCKCKCEFVKKGYYECQRCFMVKTNKTRMFGKLRGAEVYDFLKVKDLFKNKSKYHFDIYNVMDIRINKKGLYMMHSPLKV